MVWKQYRRSNFAEMRAIEPGEDIGLEGVSISGPDLMLLETNPEEFARGFIARNPLNHDDQWYVSRHYFELNFEEIKCGE
jgi:hypothetical protein